MSLWHFLYQLIMAVWRFPAIYILILAEISVIPGLSFNIDSKYPIIIQTKRTDSNPGFGGWTQPLASNYFGASVAFLKPEQGDHSWVLIGAPKANSSFHPEIPEPGSVWQCTLGKSPAETCRPVVLDPRGNLHDEKIHEWKNGSLLGGPAGLAVSSQSFVACASRLERWEDGRGKLGTTVSYMHGSCYVRPKSHLLQSGPLPPAMANDFRQLNPLQEPQWENNRINRNGQAGFAVHFSKGGSELVMSAPGIHRWMGNLIQYISRDGGRTFQKGVVSKPNSCPASGRDCFNFLGYSLTSGYYYERDVSAHGITIYYAAGAPRANRLTGKVVIFRFPEDTSAEDLLVQQELEGDQTGAYFGSSLLSLDLNGDGYDELLVGSPNWSKDQRQRPIGRMMESLMDPRGRAFDPFRGYGDEGAVFIYWSTDRGRGSLTRQKDPIRGASRPYSHFGTAMASLGDLNGDGFPDFCVSAPFEDTSGVIYIYHGNKDKMVSKYSQVIRGKAVDSGLRGFGFSLTGNEDVDNNGFPDLAVGSFNSSSVVVLRSRPIITVEGSVKSDLLKLPVDIETFEVSSCVSITAQSPLTTREVTLTIDIVADAKYQPHRVHVYMASQKQKVSRSELRYTQRITPGQREICTALVATVAQPLDTTSAPVVFSQKITLPEAEGSTVSKRTMMIDTGSGSLAVSGAKLDDFCKNCPLIDVDQPSEFDVTLPLAIPCGDDDRCHADLKLDVKFENVDTRFLVGSASTVVMNVKMTNRNETAIQPGVLITWRKLKLSRVPSGCSVSKEDGLWSTFRCGFGRYLKQGETVEVSLEFDMRGLHVSESGGMDTELFWNVTADTVSEVTRRESITVGLPLTYMADPHISGSRRFELFNMLTLAKYIVFTHQFDIQLDGYSPIQGITATFQLPVNLTTESGEDSLVNVRGVKVVSAEEDAGFSCQVTRGHFSKNEDALVAEEEADYDDQFDAAGIGGLLPKDKDLNRQSNSSFVENGRLLLHCLSPFVACMEVRCKKDAKFYPGALQEIKFIIDVASDDIRRLMKVHKVSAIEIESRGQLVLGDVIKDIQPKGSNKMDETVAVTLIEKEGHKPISKWVYILAVVIGILILVCVLFCLYACGCFENKKMVKSGDQVDGDGEAGSTEEMKSLHESSKVENEEDDEMEEAEIVEAVDETTPLSPMSPFSDVVDPPEFVPSQPTIPEETENDRTETGR